MKITDRFTAAMDAAHAAARGKEGKEARAARSWAFVRAVSEGGTRGVPAWVCPQFLVGLFQISTRLAKSHLEEIDKDAKRAARGQA
ncbi:hypothetical protein GCM10022229_18970 [Luteimonas lutimaris]|uniref:Uncharacterized protein n=1 Tax=Luteimonas lutimaris TaxID=698645 RepID=A0ABP7MKS7_9GAMM